jgi:uncharacterized pyridoxal phosphate-dependent enzyme
MTIYDELGIKPIISAGGTLTMLGGSLMPPEVTDAMAQGARQFVPMEELHIAAGKRIAGLCRVEAAHVCACAAAGITLMAAACMTGSDRDRIRQLPDTAGIKSQFIVQSAHRNSFDRAVRVAGGVFVEIQGADARALEAAISEQTAGIYYTHAWFCTAPALPLPQVAEIAHRHGLPLIADVAAEVPPVENLWRYFNEGADAYTFSGGKAIRGPQSTGFILGKKDLVEACRLNDCPHGGIGRGMKTGKEDICGLVRAVELYVHKDFRAEMAVWEGRVARVIETMSGIPHVRAWREFPFGDGQLIPHASISWDEEAVGITHAEAVKALLEGEPRIAVQFINPQVYGFGGYQSKELRVHPSTLQEGEDVIVAERLKEVLTGKH